MDSCELSQLDVLRIREGRAYLLFGNAIVYFGALVHGSKCKVHVILRVFARLIQKVPLTTLPCDYAHRSLPPPSNFIWVRLYTCET